MHSALCSSLNEKQEVQEPDMLPSHIPEAEYHSALNEQQVPCVGRGVVVRAAGAQWAKQVRISGHPSDLLTKLLRIQRLGGW